MKRLLLVPFLLPAVALCATVGDPPRVGRAAIAAIEKSLDDRVARLWDDNPFLLLGATRGVYLEGYGAVFTAEVNLVASPTSLMHTVLSKEDIERYRQKKLERIPQLEKALRQALASLAASMDTVPPEEQIVIVAFLSHYPWEDPNGLRVQITLQGQRKKMLEAQRAGGAGLDAAIRVTEN
jgi:hypothetical protein